MKKILFVLAVLLIVLFSNEVFGQDLFSPLKPQTLYFCPDGNYYEYPCRPYYFEPGVYTGVFFFGGIRYFYPIFPGCPVGRFHPGTFHHFGGSIGPRDFHSHSWGGGGFRGHGGGRR
jgi:hypothetical protein